MFRALCTAISFVLLISGCSHRTLAHVEISLANGNYQQAGIRLERCAKWPGKDKVACQAKLDRASQKGLSVDDFLRGEREELRIAELRASASPWDKLLLALELQSGTIKEALPNEVEILIEDAFFGFGECAKAADDDCMAQYAKMILAGYAILSDKEKLDAEEKAIYWLNLAARYGNEEARKSLISLEVDIPSPDLAMENLQETANSIASGRLIIQRKALAFQIAAEKRHRYDVLMQSLLPKMISCTSNSVGGYTYTNCW